MPNKSLGMLNNTVRKVTVRFSALKQGSPMKKTLFAAVTSIAMASTAFAQDQATVEAAEDAAPVVAPATAAPPMPAPEAQVAKTISLPKDTLIRVSPISEVTSKRMKEGQTREFRVAEEVRRDGVTVVPINAPVVATVTWRTGKGIFGKSAKFEITFTSVEIDGKKYALTGSHRQEGRGNTAAALLVSGIITGRSAVMLPDQVVNARTAEAITVSP